LDFANLHIHSIFSDGLLEIGQLAERIYSEPELVCFALTDHDTLSGIEPMFRAKQYFERVRGVSPKRFVPGVELSLVEPGTSMVVHLLGFFPGMTRENHRERLAEINLVIGRYCTDRTLRRGRRDLDDRVRCAWQMNLDGLGRRYQSADEIIGIIREASARKTEKIFLAAGKSGDVIRHPIPVTYQAFIDRWEDLAPGSTRAHISNYILRRDRKRIKELESLYRASGIEAERARVLASERQGLLNRCLRPPSGDMSTLKGLAALKRAGALTFLAHPAVEHTRFDYDTVDNFVVKPLVDAGLDGIEVFYPYDETYRREAVDHYLETALRHDLLVSGGTDYHGDGRTGLRDVEVSPGDVERLCRQSGIARANA
jgi:predicted metal-dependent phosphoesterase TrpH